MAGTLWWNVRIVTESPPTDGMVDGPPPLDEAAMWDEIEVSLRVEVESWPRPRDPSDEATIYVFGEEREVPTKQLSNLPRFETTMSAEYMNGMDEVAEKASRLA